MTTLNLKRIKKVSDRVLKLLKREYGGTFDCPRYDVDGTWHSDFIYPFHIEMGLTKMVVVLDDEDFVLKIPFSRTGSGARLINHCQKEVEIYKDAIKEGVECFFGECTYIGKFQGEKVYAMTQAFVSEDEYNDMSCRNMSDEEFSSLDSYEIFLENFKSYYGEKIADEISTFMDKEEIGDLHGGNVGFIGDALVCIDYSGVYYED